MRDTDCQNVIYSNCDITKALKIADNTDVFFELHPYFALLSQLSREIYVIAISYGRKKLFIVRTLQKAFTYTVLFIQFE
jgi:hypothetical protein